MSMLGVAALTLALTPQVNDKEAKRLLEESKRQAAAVDASFRTPGEQRPEWKKTTLTASKFAQKAAAATKNIKNVEGRFQTMVRTSEGIGNLGGSLKVKDRTTYLVDVTVMAKEPFSGRLVADGKRRWVRMDEQISGPYPLNQQITAAKTSNPENLFFKDFPRLMWQGLTDGKDAWIPTIAGLGKGMPLTVQERRMSMNGAHFLSYRLFGRTKSKAFEIVVDGTQFLPVSVLTSRVDETGKVWRTQWGAEYRRNNAFSAKVFSLSGQ